MNSQQYIEKMIQLTRKKIEALSYLLTLLNDNRKRQDVTFKQWYYDRKQKIDQAILKVDIEFLDAYHHLLNSEKVNTIGELQKEKFAIIKQLQTAISKTKVLENQINRAEEDLLEMNDKKSSSFHQKHSKHTAPRAIEAYKKFKK